MRRPSRAATGIARTRLAGDAAQSPASSPLTGVVVLDPRIPGDPASARHQRGRASLSWFRPTFRDRVRLLVVRHGQQERDGHDGPLTALGREQATDTAAGIGLAGNDRLVSSSLRRAVQTATAFARAPEQYGDVDEFRLGPQWTWAQADDHENLALWRPEHRPRGGESLREFQGRVEGAVAFVE
jgi:hypothetical protein